MNHSPTTDQVAEAEKDMHMADTDTRTDYDWNTRCKQLKAARVKKKCDPGDRESPSIYHICLSHRDIFQNLDIEKWSLCRTFNCISPRCAQEVVDL